MYSPESCPKNRMKTRGGGLPCIWERTGICLIRDLCPRAVGNPMPYADSKFCSRSFTVEVGIVSLLSYIYRHSKITLANGQFFSWVYGVPQPRQPLLITVCIAGERSFKDINDAQMHKIKVLKRACVPPLKMKSVPGISWQRKESRISQTSGARKSKNTWYTWQI